MAILPLLAVSVLLDGRRLLAYAPALVIAGRTYAPVAPYLTSIAQSVSYVDGALIVQRAGREVKICMPSVEPGALDFAYVPIAPLLRDLGANVRYDARDRTLEIRLPHAVDVETPPPWSAQSPHVVPRVVFTPTPQPQQVPAWHGPAIPRRTPLPYPVPT